MIGFARRVGTWLRVGLFAPDELALGGTPWSVKLDSMTLDYASAISTAVPEPSLAAVVVGGVMLAMRRSRERSRRFAQNGLPPRDSALATPFGVGQIVCN